jgi:hypothetical protein
MWAQHTFQVKYVWSNTCGRAEREDVDRRSRSETSEQSGADRNNRNKNRKRCDIIAATTHQACAKDALSALKMPLQSKLWVTKNQTCRMHNGTFRNGEPQGFYYPDNDPVHPGHFKGMVMILKEQGFDVRGLKAQCKVAFTNCNDPSSAGQCCCH